MPTEPSPAKPWSDWRYLPLAIFFIALLLRLVYLQQSLGNPLLYSYDLDEAYYIGLAQRIASGFLVGENRPFFMDPLYGYVLGGLFKLTGDNLTVIRIIQILFDSANTLLLLFIGTRLGNRRAGAIAAIFYAFYNVAFFYDLLILKTTFSVGGVLLFIALFLKVSPTRNKLAWFALGLFFALLVYLRANLLLLAPLTVVFYWFVSKPTGKEFAQKMLLFLGGAILLLSLGAIRTHMVSGETIFLNSQSGRLLYSSNNPENLTGTYGSPSFSRPRPSESEEDFHQEAERRTGRTLSVKEVSDFWTRETILFVRDQPALFGRALLNKFKWSLSNYEIPVNNSFAVNTIFAPILSWPMPGFLWAAALGFPGLFLAIRRKKENAYLLIPILTSGITMMIFYSSSRFRMPAIPFLLLGGGFFCDYIIGFFKRQERKKLAGAIVSCLVIAGLIMPIDPPVKNGFEELLLARSFWALKDGEQAWQIATLGADKFPQNVNFPLLLGIIALVNNDHQEAIRQNKTAIEIAPGNPTAHHHLGVAYLKNSQPLKAREEIQQALSLGHDPKYLFSLAESYAATGNRSLTLEYYQRFVDLARDDRALHDKALSRIKTLKR